MGRPSIFTQTIADEICERIASGEVLEKICQDEHMPAWSTARKWRDSGEYPDFAAAYARARDARAEAAFDNLEETAAQATPENVQVVRLKVDTLKWKLSRIDPNKYGDKVKAELSGPGGNPIETINRVERVIVGGNAANPDS